jgi:hypothetical protein
MFDDTGRRRFLQLAGTGTALSLSGCNALSNHDGDEAAGGASDTDGADARTVTFAVRPDQQSLQTLQSEIQERVQSGELDRTEAQAEFRSRRLELTTEAVDAFRNRTTGASMTVDDAVSQFGVVLVSGDATALIDALAFEEVGGMLPASAFEQARTQAEGTANDTATSPP